MKERRGEREDRVVLVTGASSGIGRSIGELLAGKGFRVFGTSRDPGRSAPSELAMLPLDVRSDLSVDGCIRDVLLQSGRLDVLINNAGYDLAGALEETSLAEAKEQFETNFFGTARMTQAVLPVMRRQRSGWIVMISSLAGLLGVPFHGFYSASKHALEGYTETLRHEVKVFNIRVSLIEPSYVRTSLTGSSRTAANSISDYDGMRRRALAVFERSVQEGAAPEEVANVVAAVLMDSSPRLRYRVGILAKWLPRLRAVSSQRSFEAGTRRTFHLDKEAGS
jgi:NAD(P)-dependent dehydrogenase (short-subunit alcohol dehydrogenase family)